MNDVDTAGDQRTKTHPYLSRRSLIKLICLVGAGLGLLINGCDQGNADPSQNNEAKENIKMESAIVTSNIRPQIPPLDISQPQGLKTATFALG